MSARVNVVRQDSCQREEDERERRSEVHHDSAGIAVLQTLSLS